MVDFQAGVGLSLVTKIGAQQTSDGLAPPENDTHQLFLQLILDHK
ncbi:MAG: hypothetical protein AAF821_09360 [Cyanobacteria bacterium P01_D01_bin.156]